ncbi:hypothetical protein [Xylanimonas protaetiae]|uniref:Uncharacterized protein n=1 Tax=Xylanimonas protaetiae TaxID=2509457 RepID=A0A4P6F1L2_9MICO|nr:hypothetical protein [Xylanimonas protaetiae]QAY69382.1 hypothetical protein ET471_04435 [Xylanimonas protaetiae]
MATGGWSSGPGAAAELGVAHDAVGDALDALRRAGVLAWDSRAGDAFRARLEEVVVSVHRDDGTGAALRRAAWALEPGR